METQKKNISLAVILILCFLLLIYLLCATIAGYLISKSNVLSSFAGTLILLGGIISAFIAVILIVICVLNLNF